MYHIHIASKRSCYVYYLLVVAEKTEVRASVFSYALQNVAPRWHLAFLAFPTMPIE